MYALICHKKASPAEIAADLPSIYMSTMGSGHPPLTAAITCKKGFTPDILTSVEQFKIGGHCSDGKGGSNCDRKSDHQLENIGAFDMKIGYSVNKQSTKIDKHGNTIVTWKITTRKKNKKGQSNLYLRIYEQNPHKNDPDKIAQYHKITSLRISYIGFCRQSH